MDTYLLMGVLIVLAIALGLFARRYILIRSLKKPRVPPADDRTKDDIVLGIVADGQRLDYGDDNVELGPVVESEDHEQSEEINRGWNNEYQEPQPEIRQETVNEEIKTVDEEIGYETEAEVEPKFEFVDPVIHEPEYQYESEAEEFELWNEEKSISEYEPQYPDYDGTSGDDEDKSQLPLFAQGSRQEEDNGESEFESTFETAQEIPLINGASLPDFRSSSDRMIDVVAWLPEGPQAQSSNHLLSTYHLCETRLEKSHRLIGMDVDTGNWNDLENNFSANYYTDIVLTMQLVDSAGPVNSNDWLHFTELVLQFSTLLKRPYRLSMSMQETLEEAQFLYEKTADFNQQAIMILRPADNSGFSAKGVEYIARECGFKKLSHDTYEMTETENGGHPLFSLVNYSLPKEKIELEEEQVNGEQTKSDVLILVSNLPCVSNPGVAFEVMMETATELQDRMSVDLLDQNFRPFKTSSLSVIKSQINNLADEMSDFGVPPGSQTALRLFRSAVDDTLSMDLFTPSISHYPGAG